ncbi:MAG: hypothetical protein JETT_3377 [Candidatus Jettenia ecosi]|uniref:Uncharacterized protein n=1 Tax=Candidatus Jettenia ecosi TaxID=2494326 RepID=A0A533Q6X7_9BACT|nr:MAG: hypothetical protein JETT_3377 [Candidatus Jettenia ecosi]
MKLGASYFANRILRHVREDMKKMTDDGCNFVVHTLSEHDTLYHSGTMVDIVKASHEAGLEVFLDPWGVGRVFGGESFSTFVKLYPHCRQRLNFPEGEIRTYKACLNSKTFRDTMLAWIELAAKTKAEGILWDEPHLFFGEFTSLFGGLKRDIWGCTCNVCGDIFKHTYGYEMPLDFTEDVKTFRQMTIVNFLTYLADEASEKGLKSAVCLFPTTDPRYGIYEWEKVAAIKSINIFGSDPYWYSYKQDVTEFVSRISYDVITLSEKYNKEPQIWIQGYRVPANREEEITTAIDVAYNSGIRNIATWSFEGTDCMAYVRSERPEVVWHNVRNAYLKYKNI